jgi:DNA polymerase III epsilon subunit-like protein
MKDINFTGIGDELGVFPNLRLVFLDTETTGLTDPHVIELAYKVNGHRTHKFRFNPTKRIDIGASKVHGIYIEDLKNKPRFEHSVKNRLQKLLDHSILVAHNASFDVKVLRNHGVYVRRYICTKRLAQLLSKFDDIPFKSHTLDDIASYYKVTIDRPIHDAGIDVDILYEIYTNLTHRIYEIFGMPYSKIGMYMRLVHLSRIKFGKNSQYNTLLTPFDDVRDLTYKEFLSHEHLIHFGKHKGRSIYDLICNQPDYIDWCMDTFTKNNKFHEWRHFVTGLKTELKWLDNLS